jgi:type III pantothenate kinase
MNLIIDVGNTRVKLAVFSQNALLFQQAILLKEFEFELEATLKAYPALKKAIIASVGKLAASQVALVKARLITLELSQDLNVPFINLYKTPHSLGVDRIALVSASVFKFPNKNVLIIDAGTCITYDFINAQNQYLGGAISPGIRLRYESLHNHTAKLPLLPTTRPVALIGNATNSAIHSGVVNGISMEIDGILNDYHNNYSDLTVILTGGDAEFLSNQLKNGIFATSNFLLEGLNFILEYNTN